MNFSGPGNAMKSYPHSPMSKTESSPRVVIAAVTTVSVCVINLIVFINIPKINVKSFYSLNSLLFGKPRLVSLPKHIGG